MGNMGDFHYSYENKKVTFIGTAAHKGITSDHCRAMIASFFWQNEDTEQAGVIAERLMKQSELSSLADPQKWVRSRKRTNVENMRRDIPNHVDVARKHGKIEEREFRNKTVKGILCHVYSAGDQMLRFTAFKGD